MAIRFHVRGHLCASELGPPRVTRYADGVVFIPGGGSERPCVGCGLAPTAEGHDACLGLIEGIWSACCGHGVVEPYLVTNEGLCLRGDEAREYFAKHASNARLSLIPAIVTGADPWDEQTCLPRAMKGE